MIKKNPRTNPKKLAAAINKSRATVARHFKILKDAGIIKRKGSKKDGEWEVLN